MSEILTNNKYYKDIADTIRQMKGVATTYKPREMAGALREMYSTEVEGVPPLSFPSNGNNLLNYRIDGASSEVGDRTANLLDYNWLFDYEQKRVNEYFNYIQIALEPNTTYQVTSNYNYNQAQNATAFIVVNSNTDITTANGGIFGSLTVTTTQDGILKIARRIKGNNETMIPKREDFENNSKYIQISINSVNGVGDRTKNLANSNEMIQGYWAYANGDFVYANTWICTPKIACKGNVDYTFQFANNSRWYGFVWYGENGNYISTSNIQSTSSTPYRTYTATSPSNARCLVVNIAGFPQSGDIISVSDLINFQLEEGPTPTDYEPYGYKIPVVCGGTTTNIYIDEPIRANESKSLSDTNVNIPTINGTNILSIDTTVQPSNVYVQAPKGGSSGRVENPALVLWDWEGTKLAEYSAHDVQSMTTLPAPDTLPSYVADNHEFLTFQEWNWSLVNIKTWIQNHEGKTLDVGAIYTTTDGQDHNYWRTPRLESTAKAIYMQKRATVGIGSYAFQNCYSLTQINIPNGLTRIGNSAFDGCYSLTKINIPNGVTSIGNSAFDGCYSLTKINIPNGVTSIGSYAFFRCSSLAEINIPNGVTSIGSYAFQNCYSLTQINIPDSVTSIGNAAFFSCSSLTKINIPNGVTSIGNSAFDGCYSLTKINIPNGVTSIGNSTFQNCPTLCDVLLESKPTLGNTNAFSNILSNYRIYVPRANLSWFETETNWSTIYTGGHIVAIEDYINYLESLGFDVDKYKDAMA